MRTFINLFEMDPHWSHLHTRPQEDQDMFFLRTLHIVLGPLCKGNTTPSKLVPKPDDSDRVKAGKTKKMEMVLTQYKEQLTALIQDPSQVFGFEQYQGAEWLASLDVEAMANNARQQIKKATNALVTSQTWLLHPADSRATATDAALAKKMMSPTDLLAQNSKLAKTGGSPGFNYAVFETSLPAFTGLFYDMSEQKFKVLVTCPFAGTCALDCYVGGGSYIQNAGPYMRQAKLLTLLMNKPDVWKKRTIGEILSKAAYPIVKGKDGVEERDNVAIRWHDSGDIFDQRYFDLMMEVVAATPDVLHYTYTKSVALMKAQASFPPNFVVNLSKGGRQDSQITANEAGGKASTIVPKEVFKEFSMAGGVNHIDPAKMPDLKQRIADLSGDPGGPMGDLTSWNVHPGNILTFEELQAAPVNPDEPKHVIITTADGDDPAMRRDVKITFLLLH